MNIISEYQKDIIKYKNIYKNKSCYIIGSGPSINSFQEQEEGIYIGCNHIIKNKYFKNKLHFYFFGDGYTKYIDDSNKIYGNHKKEVDDLDIKINKLCMVSLNNNLNVHGFNKNIIDDLYKNKNTIPCDMNLETLHKNLEKNPFINHSIVFSACQFALYCGFTKIYLVGCDANGFFHSNSYFKKSNNNNNNNNILIKWWKKIYEHKNKFYSSASIININPIGLKDLMDKDIYTNINNHVI